MLAERLQCRGDLSPQALLPSARFTRLDRVRDEVLAIWRRDADDAEPKAAMDAEQRALVHVGHADVDADSGIGHELDVIAGRPLDCADDDEPLLTGHGAGGEPENEQGGYGTSCELPLMKWPSEGRSPRYRQHRVQGALHNAASDHEGSRGTMHVRRSDI